jgi:hypothetical protein
MMDTSSLPGQILRRHRMESPIDTPRPESAGREEGFLHYVAREGRVVLRWTIGACLVAIVACMVSPGFFFLAVIPAIVLLAAYILLLLANEIERRSDSVAHEALERAETAGFVDVVEDHAEDDQLEAVQAEIVKRESRVGITILVAVLIVASIIAFVIFDLKLLAIGAFVLFAYMLLIAAPFWLGWFNDDIEDETHKLQGEPQSARVKTQ